MPLLPHYLPRYAPLYQCPAYTDPLAYPYPVWYTCTMNIIASEVRVGDVVVVRIGTTARVDSIIGTTDKTIRVRLTYVTCGFAPSRIGQQWSQGYRLTTTLVVER
jgi:hypothetical protein